MTFHFVSLPNILTEMTLKEKIVTKEYFEIRYFRDSVKVVFTSQHSSQTQTHKFNALLQIIFCEFP